MNHIAFVIPTIDRLGGAERQMLLLAGGLLRRGWRVNVIALSGSGGHAASELVAAGAGFLTLHMRKGVADPRGWILLHRWLRRELPDVVHAHLPHATWMTRWSRLASPSRVVVDTIHTSATGGLGRHLGYRWSNWLPDRVTAVSQCVADAYLSAQMASAARLLILPNGVDLDDWKPDAAVRARVREDLKLEGEFLWFAAGRLDPVKDYPTLLRAMTRLPASVRLVIAGGGPLEFELRQLSRALNLESRVRFIGFETDVRRWVQAADGFVLASRWEGLPMCLIEAGACAVPAVATDVSGSREIIVDGQTGLLAEAGNVSTLEGAMTAMMRLTPEERSAMGDRARRRILELFNIEAVLDQWETLYMKLLENSPRPARWGGRCEPGGPLNLSACDGASFATGASSSAKSHIPRITAR